MDLKYHIQITVLLMHFYIEFTSFLVFWINIMFCLGVSSVNII